MSVKIDLNHKIHVPTKKGGLDGVRIPGKVVVVLDILFATTTMVTALAHGAPAISSSASPACSARRPTCRMPQRPRSPCTGTRALPTPCSIAASGA